MPESDPLTWMRIVGAFIHLRHSKVQKKWNKLDKLYRNNPSEFIRMYGHNRFVGEGWEKERVAKLTRIQQACQRGGVRIHVNMPTTGTPTTTTNSNNNNNIVDVYRTLEELPRNAQKDIVEELSQFCRDNFIRMKVWLSSIIRFIMCIIIYVYCILFIVFIIPII